MNVNFYFLLYNFIFCTICCFIVTSCFRFIYYFIFKKLTISDSLDSALSLRFVCFFTFFIFSLCFFYVFCLAWGGVYFV